MIYDFIIIPGLVFDKNCHRLGYGYGHYDYFLSRYFESLKESSQHTKLSKWNKKKNSGFIINLLVGVGFDEQISSDLLPFEDHDIQLQTVITPSYTITINS